MYPQHLIIVTASIPKLTNSTPNTSLLQAYDKSHAITKWALTDVEHVLLYAVLVSSVYLLCSSRADINGCAL